MKMFNEGLAALNSTDTQDVPRPCEVLDFGTARLRVAVREACAAYSKSGRMLDAALTYAQLGIPVFPLTIDKEPVPPRDKDANGKKIPGTGSFKKATTDPKQIHKWWKKHEYLIGLRMGAPSGVWCLDIDTGEDHADGVAEWEKIVAQHVHVQQHQDKHSGQRYEVVTPPFVTREHRSATGGPHLIFKWDPERPIGCSSGDLPDGISVKGAESYIVAPPSRRKKPHRETPEQPVVGAAAPSLAP
jgi:hypothetical protein